MVKTDYTREELIQICENAVVLESEWRDRDSEHSQIGVGTAWVLLKAGCKFHIVGEDETLRPDENTIWIEFESKGFNWFEMHEMSEHRFYLPTRKRLDEAEGKDWY